MHFHEKPNTYVTNVEIKVSDLHRSLKYYQDIIGFKVLQAESHKATLSADGKTALLTIVQPETVEEKNELNNGAVSLCLTITNTP